MLSAVLDASWKTVVDSYKINKAFKKFYENIYRSEHTTNVDAQTEFLDNLNIPQISEESKKNLDKQLTMLRY